MREKKVAVKRIAISCHADLRTGEGKIIMKDFFQGLAPLIKIDLVGDWKVEIDHLYDNSLKEWRLELQEANRQHEKRKSYIDVEVDDQANIKRLLKEGVHNEA